MGNGISQEQLQDHLNKQEALIRQLQAVVRQQSQSLQALGDAAVDYNKNGQGDDVALSTHLTDEVVGLRRNGGKTRKGKEEADVDADEKAVPNVEWTEPTEEEERGFMSVKPWLGAMAPPTGFTFGATDALPDVKLELEHVYGYRANAVRQNVVWVDKNTILYFAAGVGIVHDIVANKQRFFRSHSDDILCLAYHPGRRIVVTGESGKVPAMYVWDVDTCEELAKIAGFHQRAVTSVAFSLDGSKIASVGLDDNHSVAVYDWSKGVCIGSSEGDTNRILDVQFNMTADADSNVEFVTVGVKHINFWKATDGALSFNKGLIGNLGERQPYLNVAFTTQYTVLGTQTGEMYLFKGVKLSKIVAAHQKSIFAIKAFGDILVTGGKDGYVSRWDMNTFSKTGSVNMNKVENAAVLANATNQVRAVDCLSDDEIIAGTITNSIYRVKFSSSAITPVVKAHYGNFAQESYHGELWGLHPAPKGQVFATAGEDSTLRIWNASDRKLSQFVQLSSPAQSVAWSPDGKFIAVGLQNGAVAIYDKDGNELKSTTKSKRRVQSLRFSPSGKILAAGTADNVVLVFDVDKDFALRGKLTGNTSVILHLDFSEDDKYLQTCSQSYELLFFDLEKMAQFTKSRDLKDTKWATFTSILGWDVQGIWPKFSDGSDVNSVARSRSAKYLATAEDTGLVKLFRYPCVGGGLDRTGSLVRRPECAPHTGHSEHVTDVAWTEGDQRVLTTGGGDLCVFQWKVVAA